jgi:hypothetical protein
MGRGKRGTSGELQELGKRVAEWRKQGGGRGSRIPASLWEEAIRIARLEGVYATSQALNFNYRRLKERSAAPSEAPARGAEKAAVVRSGGSSGKRRSGVEASSLSRVAADERFVALPLQGAREVGAAMGDGAVVIELEKADGARLRMQLKGGVDVVGLVRAFWSPTP